MVASRIIAFLGVELAVDENSPVGTASLVVSRLLLDCWRLYLIAAFCSIWKPLVFLEARIFSALCGRYFQCVFLVRVFSLWGIDDSGGTRFNYRIYHATLGSHIREQNTRGRDEPLQGDGSDTGVVGSGSTNRSRSNSISTSTIWRIMHARCSYWMGTGYHTNQAW